MTYNHYLLQHCHNHRASYLRGLKYHLGHIKDVIVTADPFACDTERAGSQSKYNDFRPLQFPHDKRFVQTCVTQKYYTKFQKLLCHS